MKTIPVFMKIHFFLDDFLVRIEDPKRIKQQPTIMLIPDYWSEDSLKTTRKCINLTGKKR
jgi:hypothetical protein